MAEGMARLNQHVAAQARWDTSDRLRPDDARSFAEPRQEPTRIRAERRLHVVLRAVEADIVPRLVLARRSGYDPAEAAVPALAAAPGGPEESEVVRFARVLLRHGSETDAATFVGGVRAAGTSLEDVFLHLFQPAARHIGDLWLADLCTFVDVTLALGVLQRLVRDLSPAFQKEARRIDSGRVAMLVPLPGDHHTFGLSIVAEFFRRSAWSVWSEPFASCEDLGHAVHDTSFTVVGFALSREDRLDDLAAAIAVVRRESRNEDVGVLVGGPVFIAHPDYAARVGADAMGLDARQAVERAESFVEQATGR